MSSSVTLILASFRFSTWVNLLSYLKFEKSTWLHYRLHDYIQNLPNTFPYPRAERWFFYCNVTCNRHLQCRWWIGETSLEVSKTILFKSSTGFLYIFVPCSIDAISHLQDSTWALTNNILADMLLTRLTNSYISFWMIELSLIL